jgi:hypothetical protein
VAASCFSDGYILLYMESRCLKQLQKPLPFHMYNNGFNNQLLKRKKPFAYLKRQWSYIPHVENRCVKVSATVLVL